MANYTWNTSTNPATGSVAMYAFLAAMIASGWADTKDSDGTTYAPAGGQITGGAAGAHGLGNASAWFVISNGTRQYCVQRSAANDTQWRIKYSPAAGFTGGAPAATQVPSATDEVVLLGAGTDAAPTYATLFATNGSYRLNICAGKVAALWCFYMMTWPLGNAGGNGMLWASEVMSAGTYPAADTDHQANILQVTINPWSQVNLSLASNNVKGYVGGLLPANWVSIRPAQYYDGVGGFQAAPAQVGTNGDGVNAWTGNDDLLPIYYGRPSNVAAPTGYKGLSSMGYFDTVARANADTVSVASPTAKDFIWMNGICIPWDGSSPII
jgi:hypothetical protein